MLNIAWIIAALAMAFGAALGARGMVDPKWVAGLVKLQETEPTGRAEFRATYGGVFFGLHVVGLLFALWFIRSGFELAGTLAAGATAVLAAGWGGSFFGRALAMLRDGAATLLNRINLLVEFTAALALASPWLVSAFAPFR